MQDVNEKQGFSFTGNGGEYFRIWIVNLMLTIVTLGIYSAWAKVRRSQYFYRNTWVNGSSFDYHGNPMAILKGRIIAVVLFAAYNVTLNINVFAGLAIAGVIAVVMPFLLVKSFRFRLYNTSYRGLRFGFAGSVKGAYKNFLMWPLLTLPTLYLLAPFTHQRIKDYQHGNSRYGNTAFSFRAPVSDFYSIYLQAFGMMTVISGLAIAAGVGVVVYLLAMGHGGATTSDEERLAIWAIAVIYGLMIIGSLLIAPFFTARLQNVIWNHTKLGDHGFLSTLKARGIFKVGAVNLLATIFTLGLFKPYADIRMAKYRMDNMALLPAGDLEAFLASEQNNVSAVGTEAAEIFDVDLAF